MSIATSPGAARGKVCALVSGLQAAREVFESHGVKVFVDPKSLPYIDGTELDFAREGLNEGFRFHNPNVKDECGCGESFRV
jgi:iron-sulfur cluster assembly protein